MPDPNPTLFPFSDRLPGEVLQERLDERGWRQEDLAAITKKPRVAINQIINGKRGVTPEMAKALGAAFDEPPHFWLMLDANLRLSTSGVQDEQDVASRAELFKIAPVKDMQKRGWIPPHQTVEELQVSLLDFFEAKSIADIPKLAVAARKTNVLDDLNPTQRAWVQQAKRMAMVPRVAPFKLAKIPELKRHLRRLAAFPKSIMEVPEALADAGIRLVVVEPLPGGKIDGAAFWLDKRKPVIAIALRFDRIDAFWFTLMHELSHIEHGDALSVDTDLSGDHEGGELETPRARDEIEDRADAESSAALVEPEEIQSFIRRVGPLYTKVKINQFAHRIKIHPGIIVGQLQHRGEIGYGAQRQTLVKIRSIVTQTAYTDGWGHTPG